jgi:hypothetical protein
MSPGAQNVKKGPDAPGTDENDSGSAKKVNGLDAPVPSKTSPEAKNMKTGPDAHGIAENESGSTKNVNGTRCL